MATTLALAAFVMGLAGGPHCAAMCGAPCAGVIRASGSTRAGGMMRFQLGRLAGYSVAGAAAGFAVDAFAGLALNTAALRPLWTALHLAVLAWGLCLLTLARQPAWVDTAGRSLWLRVRPLAQARGGVLATGALWVFMPCGLLYSALLLASLSGSAGQGALCMALFAAGSGVSLGVFPGLVAALRAIGNGMRKDWGTRASGAVLALTAGWAVTADLVHRALVWCGLA